MFTGDAFIIISIRQSVWLNEMSFQSNYPAVYTYAYNINYWEISEISALHILLKNRLVVFKSTNSPTSANYDLQPRK